MPPALSCLTPQMLDQLAQHELSPVEMQEMEAHVSNCAACCELLERRTAEPDWLLDMRTALTTCPEIDSVNDADGDSAGWVLQERQQALEQVLKQLGPTDDPRMLGRLGIYEIVGILGRGGMGIVLKGFDATLNRYVAIKLLAPHLSASATARKRFEREARAAAAVVDDHVMAIHGVAEWQGVPYLVMPYVRGATLQRRLDEQGPFEVREVLRIGMQTARGLAAAHAQGLVHRDVKPANILLADGVERVTLTDFGLARAVDDASLTRTGVLAGTPQYMSPEQSRGRGVDSRSDLFSLGSVLYALCAGRPPFRADSSYGVLRLITDEEPQPIRELNPEIPDWLCAIIGRLMAKDPEQRFATALEVAQLLEGCLAHVQQPQSVALPAALMSVRTRRHFPASRRRRPLAIFAAIGAALLGFLAWQATAAPDIAGRWSGDDWGQVTLKRNGDGGYSGTYTDTYGKQPGVIQLKWSRIERQYRGTWAEGEDRFGDLAVRLYDHEIRGALTTDAQSKINPGTPRLTDLKWTRAAVDPEKPTVAESAGDHNPLLPNPLLPTARTQEKEETIDGWFRPDPYPQLGAPAVLGRDRGIIEMAELAAAVGETGVSPQQRAEISKILKTTRARQSQLEHDLHDEDRKVRSLAQEELNTMWPASRSAVERLLEPVQVERIHQLSYQKLGYGAFLQADVQTALQLTDGQRAAIVRANSDHIGRIDGLDAELGLQKLKHPELTPQHEHELRSWRNARGVESHRQCWNDIYRILTPEQRAQFQALRGRPVEGQIHRSPATPRPLR